MKWSYGVTTIMQRSSTLLPRTLASLAAGGFTQPRLFVDGSESTEYWSRRFCGLEVTVRHPRVQSFGHWMLTLMELYVRAPKADRFAIFQDDLIASRGLRSYLEATTLHRDAYWNLYTYPENQSRVHDDNLGWFKSDQSGQGAVGLVFNRRGVMSLLASNHLTKKSLCPVRGRNNIDGGVSEHFKQSGWTEYVHNPSPLQHTGMTSSMGNARHPLATSFRGEDYDLTELLGGR